MSYDYGTCHVCGGLIEEQLTEHSLRDGKDWVFIQDVPTGVCQKCGEQILQWKVTARIEEVLREREHQAPSGSVEVPIFAF